MKGHWDSVDINLIEVGAVSTMGRVQELCYFLRERKNSRWQISRNVVSVDNPVAANSEIFRDFFRLHFLIRERLNDKA